MVTTQLSMDFFVRPITDHIVDCPTWRKAPSSCKLLFSTEMPSIIDVTFGLNFVPPKKLHNEDMGIVVATKV